MTVLNDAGEQVPPDWSCYLPDASFLARITPSDTDAGDDAGDASDAAAAEDAADAATLADSAAPADASSGPDASPGDAGPSYILKLSDFVSSAPPVGATVSIVWGGSSLASVAYTGTVNSQGLVFFPPPPAGQQLLSYFVAGSTDADAGAGLGQSPLWWISAVIVPPPGQTSFNTLSRDNLSSLTTSILASEPPRPDLAIIVTGADDCQYRDVNGAQYNIIDTATGVSLPTGTGPGDTRAFYLQDNLPNTQCTYTTNVGGRSVWSMINAPTNLTPGATATTHTYMLQLSGRMYESQTTPVILDQYPLEAYPGTVTVQRGSRINPFPPN
jgi:hypothetical protein